MFAKPLKAWAAEERVRALKIAIQGSKMLGDTAFPQFYPALFVRVTEMRDNFGELVRGRMRKLTKEHSKGRLVITDENEDQIYSAHYYRTPNLENPS